MWTIKDGWMVWFLGAAAVWDVAKREIPVWYLVAGTIAAVIGQIVWRKEDGILVLFGVLTGLLFLLISKYTHQNVGYGDSWMILILGIVLGIWKLLVVLGIAFLGATIIAGIGMAGKKLTRKSKMPFYPFLFLGYLGVWGW